MMYYNNCLNLYYFGGDSHTKPNSNFCAPKNSQTLSDGFKYMYKLLIVDDEYIVRTGLRETVDWADNGIEVVGEASNGADGLNMILKYHPDIVLTDIRMQNMGGLELLKKVQSLEIDCEVIIISGYEEFDYVREALKCGAFAYLVKPVDNEELLETVENAIKKLIKNRSRNKYFTRLQDEIGTVKQQYLRDLLNGKISSRDELAEKLEFYNIGIDNSDSVAIYIRLVRNQRGRDNFSRSITPADIDLFLEESILPGLMSKGVSVDMSESEYAVILNVRNVQMSILRALFMDACREFTSRTSVAMSVGIGSRADSLLTISGSYKNAKIAAAGTKNLSGISTVISFNDITDLGYKREIQDAIKYICEHYAEDVTIEAVANELYISSSYLMHLFKEKLGKTFNECLTEYRITTAKELLTLNRYKIYEVSNMVGYKDVKYFSQIFKKTTGITPSEFGKNSAAHTF